MNKVLIDTTKNTITFISLFDKQTISVTDGEYFDLLYQNGFKSWHGLLIKTNNSEPIQIVEQNVKSVLELKEYLMKKGAFCAGKTKMKFPFR